MEHLNIILAVLGGLMLMIGLCSKGIEQTPLTPTVLALGFGILLGPEVSGLLDLSDLGERSRILEGTARVTLGIGLVGVALRIPREFPRRHWRGVAVLIGAAMPLMWIVTTALIYLILGIPFLLAALIGAIAAATDPIAASPIVTGPGAQKYLPERLRHLISLESGANDGLGYLFVLLPFLLLTRPPEDALLHWFSKTLLYEVVFATVFGLVLGVAAAKLLQLAAGRDLIEDDWRLVYTAALALFAVGAGRLVKSDEVLLVFAAGCAFVQVVSAENQADEERGQEAVNRFFAVPIFTVLGIAIPWHGWSMLGWRGVLLVLCVLLFRRLPALLLLRPFIPSLRGRADVLFVGWFGPVAVAAIYYASLMEHKLSNPFIWDVISLIICASTVVHGMTASPFIRWYGRAAGHGATEGGENG